MPLDVLAQARQFVREESVRNPSYDVDNWHILADYSTRVQDIAEELAGSLQPGIQSDPKVVAIGALLYSIGKKYEPPTTGEQRSPDGAAEASHAFLRSLGLLPEQLKLLEDVVSSTGDSSELKIVQDADTIAFYSDRRFNRAVLEWAAERGHHDLIQGKLDAANLKKLHFSLSRDLAVKPYERMLQDWKPYEAMLQALKPHLEKLGIK